MIFLVIPKEYRRSGRGWAPAYYIEENGIVLDDVSNLQDYMDFVDFLNEFCHGQWKVMDER